MSAKYSLGLCEYSAKLYSVDMISSWEISAFPKWSGHGMGNPSQLHLVRPTVLKLLNSGLLYTCENTEDPRELLFMWDICWYLYY